MTIDIKSLEKSIKDKTQEQIDILSNDSVDTISIEKIKSNFMSKKGFFSEQLKQIKDVSDEDKPKLGQIIQKSKKSLEEKISSVEEIIQNNKINEKIISETIDITLPGRKNKPGKMHVLKNTIRQLENIFIGMGFSIHDGKQVESDFYNFERMNIPKNHPARDMQDTFYLSNDLLLRTQTSAVQPKILSGYNFEKGPLKVISPGIVYRRDTDDATHSHQFFQLEGIVVDKNVSFLDLKSTLENLITNFFGDEYKTRLRPSYFPFTEPSIELDILWEKNGEKKWIEVLGAGMIHPNVLRMSGVDPEIYSGFAFGLGPDRFAMIKNNLEDIRQFYLNDDEFIESF